MNSFGTAASGKAFAITPSDTDDLEFPIRGIYVGGAGNLALELEDSTTAVVFVGATAGSLYPFRARKVKSTSTTATNIVGVL